MNEPIRLRMGYLAAACRVLALPALILLAIFRVYLNAYRSYYPSGDDVAVIRASEGPISKWFTEGFSKYFVVYPEWESALTDFLRPGFNLIVRSEQAFFKQHYGFYFAVYYLAQLLVCAVVLAIARKFGFRSRWLYVLAAVTALSPAFVGEGLLSISFAFDVWCGLFAMLALYCLLRQWYGLTLFCLTLAVFTKETSLYAPVAAAFAVYLDTRRKLLSAAMLLPLIAWACIWKFVFVGTPAGIYVLQGGMKAVVIGVGRGLLNWPTCVLDESSVRRIFVDHAVRANLPDLLILLANLVLWGCLIAITVQLVRQYIVLPSAVVSGNAGLLLVGVLWLWCALGFGVLVARQSRFGGSIYPLECIVCLAVFQTRSHRVTRALSGLAFGLIVAAFLWNARVRLHQPSPQSGRTMKNLVSAIQHDPASNIYVLNSVAAFSNPQSIAEFAGMPSAKIIILNQASGCSTAPATPPTIHEEGVPLKIISILPDCAGYEFDEVPLEVMAKGFQGTLARGQFAAYSFPEGRVLRHALGNAQKISAVDLGREMDVTLNPEPGKSFVILYYDWNRGRFDCAGKDCSPSHEDGSPG